MQIGSYSFDTPFFLAPMAGITDGVFREICHNMGAGLTVSEMLWADPSLQTSRKTQQRMALCTHNAPHIVQIAGCDPQLMAQAAQYNVAQGADMIDINMGCPAKKVNRKKAGSVLMQHPELVKEILCAVVDAVDVPVTLKTRTGYSMQQRNGIEIAQIAQECGIAALAVHGRTRACLFKGQAEYKTIKAIKQSVSIPVIANGDIVCIDSAERVLEYTRADALMIGRGAQGNPWIFQQLNAYFQQGIRIDKPTLVQQSALVLEHIKGLYALYGPHQGVRIARKHVGWYLKNHPEQQAFRQHFNLLIHPQQQCEALEYYFHSLPLTSKYE